MIQKEMGEKVRLRSLGKLVPLRQDMRVENEWRMEMRCIDCQSVNPGGRYLGGVPILGTSHCQVTGKSGHGHGQGHGHSKVQLGTECTSR